MVKGRVLYKLIDTYEWTDEHLKYVLEPWNAWALDLQKNGWGTTFDTQIDIVDNTFTYTIPKAACPTPNPNGSSGQNDNQNHGQGTTRIQTSWSPEDKWGPAGYDAPETPAGSEKRYVAGDRAFEYRIEMWNKPEAPVPTQDATIYDYLDPVTGEYPDDPHAGFLPPFNPATGFEIGWMEFRVNPKAGLPSGAELSNQAFVQFDFLGPWGPAPKQRPWVNTIDAALPSSAVAPLPATLAALDIPVAWAGAVWHRCQTARDGFLTAEALQSGASGTVRIDLFDAAMEPLASSLAVEGVQRLDYPTAAAGQVYYLKLAGSASDVDLRLTNLVNHTGTAVAVAGTDIGDQFEFSAAGSRRLKINGVVYDFDEAAVATPHASMTLRPTIPSRPTQPAPSSMLRASTTEPMPSTR